MTPQAFITMIMEEVVASGIKFEITKGRYVSCGSLCSGYFEVDEKNEGILKVAGGRKGWFSVLVHEYCHFTQWRDNCKPWRDLKNSSDFEDWCSGKQDFPEKVIDRHFKAVRNMELDCERRSIRLIKKYDLPIDIKSYVKAANAYIYFHAYIRKYRTWYKGISPYRSKRICKIMPVVFLGRDKYNIMPEKYEQLVNEICFKGTPNEKYYKKDE